ncbi:DNA polymerase III subunit delta [Phocaeicola coprophilus]|uniref:DNA polymerase III, delta subunit n=1 Tax=Phocaeicola coprophilus DSM 18228 = JCM 13818 TaxID=547042 RepID=S0F9J2_9BACT|nr:DNA polymerase III subunit delta [Phocaeicola coprophilus]EEF77093.1 DNA polymerase III, delta subunit [Phocaeicola coprophilus DSM 18228 = JCM 13818]QRO25853.1 DNA polymerase III subunit delta [Phocaeicola coprophilus]
MAKETTYEEIARNLKNKIYSPVYFLMGEEDYYIDRISDYIMDTVLTETEKEFNLTLLYGSDTDIVSIINAARRYPMMSKYQVVIVREAQNLKNLDELIHYLQKPMSSTILVMCYKHGTLDRRKKITAELEKAGVLFESKKLKDTQLPGFISSYLKRKQVEIEPKASEMMAEFVGTDLNRMAGELEKLIITLPAGQKRITAEQIERNIGISKDYNNFELRNALIEKDVFKANQIVKYFEDNPKNNPLQVTLAVLFNFFSNLMLAYYAPDKSDQGIASQLGLRSPWQAKDYMAGMRKYTGVKVMQIIGAIRTCDAKSKGIDNPSIPDGELLRELVYFILH